MSETTTRNGPTKTADGGPKRGELAMRLDELAELDPALAALLLEEGEAIKAELAAPRDLSVEEVRSLEARADDLWSRIGQAMGLPAGLTCEQIMARVVVR